LQTLAPIRGRGDAAQALTAVTTSEQLSEQQGWHCLFGDLPAVVEISSALLSYHTHTPSDRHGDLRLSAKGGVIGCISTSRLG
jgi:hypothetical protein